MKTFPLSPARVNGNEVILNDLVKNPAPVSAYIADTMAANLVSQFLFHNTPAQGGALLYEQMTGTNPYAEDEPGVIAPGAEFPVLRTSTLERKAAKVKKVGGKIIMTREAMIRNDQAALQRGMRQVANTMARAVDRMAFKALNETLEATPNKLEIESEGWVAATKVAKNNASVVTGPGKIMSDIVDAQVKVEETRIGYRADTLITTPKIAGVIRKTLGTSEYRGALSDMGIANLYVSTEIEDGQALLTQAGVVGAIGVEDPISTDSDYLKATQTTEFYTWATMAVAITDPLAVVRLKNLAA